MIIILGSTTYGVQAQEGETIARVELDIHDVNRATLVVETTAYEQPWQTKVKPLPVEPLPGDPWATAPPKP